MTVNSRKFSIQAHDDNHDDSSSSSFVMEGLEEDNDDDDNLWVNRYNCHGHSNNNNVPAPSPTPILMTRDGSTLQQQEPEKNTTIDTSKTNTITDTTSTPINEYHSDLVDLRLRRKRRTWILGVAGGVAGIVLLGPLAGIAGGVAAALGTKAVGKRCERKRLNELRDEQQDDEELSTTVSSDDLDMEEPTSSSLPQHVTAAT